MSTKNIRLPRLSGDLYENVMVYNLEPAPTTDIPDMFSKTRVCQIPPIEIIFKPPSEKFPQNSQKLKTTSFYSLNKITGEVSSALKQRNTDIFSSQKSLCQESCKTEILESQRDVPRPLSSRIPRAQIKDTVHKFIQKLPSRECRNRPKKFTLQNLSENVSSVLRQDLLKNQVNHTVSTFPNKRLNTQFDKNNHYNTPFYLSSENCLSKPSHEKRQNIAVNSSSGRISVKTPLEKRKSKLLGHLSVKLSDSSPRKPLKSAHNSIEKDLPNNQWSVPQECDTELQEVTGDLYKRELGKTYLAEDLKKLLTCTTVRNCDLKEKSFKTISVKQTPDEQICKATLSSIESVGYTLLQTNPLPNNLIRCNESIGNNSTNNISSMSSYDKNFPDLLLINTTSEKDINLFYGQQVSSTSVRIVNTKVGSFRKMCCEEKSYFYHSIGTYGDFCPGWVFITAEITFKFPCINIISDIKISKDSLSQSYLFSESRDKLINIFQQQCFALRFSCGKFKDEHIIVKVCRSSSGVCLNDAGTGEVPTTRLDEVSEDFITQLPLDANKMKLDFQPLKASCSEQTLMAEDDTGAFWDYYGTANISLETDTCNEHSSDGSNATYCLDEGEEVEILSLQDLNVNDYVCQIKNGRMVLLPNIHDVTTYKSSFVDDEPSELKRKTKRGKKSSVNSNSYDDRSNKAKILESHCFMPQDKHANLTCTDEIKNTLIYPKRSVYSVHYIYAIFIFFLSFCC